MSRDGLVRYLDTWLSSNPLFQSDVFSSSTMFLIIRKAMDKLNIKETTDLNDVYTAAYFMNTFRFNIAVEMAELIRKERIDLFSFPPEVEKQIRELKAAK